MISGKKIIHSGVLFSFLNRTILNIVACSDSFRRCAIRLDDGDEAFVGDSSAVRDTLSANATAHASPITEFGLDPAHAHPVFK